MKWNYYNFKARIEHTEKKISEATQQLAELLAQKEVDLQLLEELEFHLENYQMRLSRIKEEEAEEEAEEYDRKVWKELSAMGFEKLPCPPFDGRAW